MTTSLADVLNEHLANRGWSFKKLAAATGLPRNTVYRWTRGEVSKVRHWQDLVIAARALGLGRSQANTLLAIGGHAPIDVLRVQAIDEEDRTLLAHWAPAPPHNLPQHLTSFVGRSDELQHIARAISSARLVTLTGPGGSGKTRLATEAAHTALGAFDGAAFIDLAAVRDPEQVIPAISQALELPEPRDEPPVTALATHLWNRNTLLVLDNFEQVIAAAPLVTELLGRTQQLKALVTSRARLDVRGEHEIAVPPLSLPGPASGFDELTHNAAVVLFADRARAVDAAFTLTPGNVHLVAAVCAHLDGLPLGIELAAARTRQVGLPSLLERIPTRLALANKGPRDLADRQRTMRATIAWSYDLLDSEAQRLFTCLGVFAGGVSVAAAGSVSAALGLQIDTEECLESLVDQSLLQRTGSAGNAPGYRMLETIREYAREQLEGAGKAPEALAAHARYFLNLAEGADLQGHGQTHWLNALAAEHDNFRAALQWCREQGRNETGLRLSVALTPLWQWRDHQLEARAWLNAFMASEGTVSPDTWANGLLWHGLLLMRGTGDVAAAARYFDEALVLFRRQGNLAGTIEALQAQGDMYRLLEAWEPARTWYGESLELARQSNHAHLAAHGYMGLAFCAQEDGQFEAARCYWASTLEWAEMSGNRGTIAMTLNSLGEMARHVQDWAQAQEYYQQTLHIAEELGSEFWKALALHNLGYVALHGGEFPRARELFADSLLLYARQQHRKGQAECLAGLGKVEASGSDLDRAARLCGASETILNGLRMRLDALDRADYLETLEVLRFELGDRLETRLDEGRAMSMEEAVAYAIPDRDQARGSLRLP